MSISRFQEKLFGKGCGSAILIGCAVVFGAYAFQYWGKAGQMNDPNGSRQTSKLVLNVAGQPVYADGVDLEVTAKRNQMVQMGMPMDSVNPQLEVQIYEEAIRTKISQAAVIAIGAKNGIKISDDQVKKTALDTLAKSVQSQLDQVKMQAIQAGQLKPTATPSEFDEYLKKSQGQSGAQMLLATTTKFEEAFKDPQRQASVRSDIAPIAIESELESKTPVSDEIVNQYFTKNVFKRIVLKNADGPSAPASQQIATIKDELAKGTSFETLIDRYTTETPKPGQKLSAVTTTMAGRDIMSSEIYGPLKALRAGQVSDPIKEAVGTCIYKLISTSDDKPKDFSTQKLKYTQEVKQALARAMISSGIKTVMKTQLQWKSKGYQVVFDLSEIDSDSSLSSTERDAAYQKIADAAKAALASNDGYDLRPAQLVQFVAFDHVWNAAGTDKAKLKAQRIQVLSEFLQNSESFDVRKELVTLLAAAKDPLVFDNLMQLARSNNNFDAIGQSHFGDVAGLLLQMKSAGLLTADQVASVEQEQARWQKDKLAYDADKVKQKAQDDADKKAAAEAAQKEKELAKKANASKAPASAGAAAPTPATTGGGFNPGQAPTGGPLNGPSSLTSTGG